MSTKVPTEDMIELENLFGPLFDEYLNEENQVVLKSSAVTTADASDKRQQQPDSTSSASTLATTISTNGHFDVVVSLSCSGNVTASTAATTLSRRYKMKYLSESYEIHTLVVAIFEQEVAATVESMETTARYMSNKYVEAALNSTTVVLPYLIPVSCFSSLYLYDITLMLPI
ncbi:hypothetical protein Tco_0898536 [Tanacetum coccineum]